MIIDFTTKQPIAEGERAEQPPNTKAAILDNEANRTLMLQRPNYGFDKCYHRKVVINDEQRTVKCGACGMWLDPVWVLRELFYYYEHRIDSRLEDIKAFDKREKERREKKAQRQARPRAHLIKRREESLERAAYNEYQSKLLAIRAEKQRTTAKRLEHEIAQAVDAVDPVAASSVEPSTREKTS